MYRVHYSFVIYDDVKEEVVYAEKDKYDVSSNESPTGKECRKKIWKLAEAHCTNKNYIVRHANYFKIEKL